MGSADKKQADNSADKKLVNVQTAELKEKLNRLYARMREATLPSRPDPEHFDTLWDLKELALLERRQSVDVPENWLAETEDLDDKRRVRHGN